MQQREKSSPRCRAQRLHRQLCSPHRQHEHLQRYRLRQRLHSPHQRPTSLIPQPTSSKGQRFRFSTQSRFRVRSPTRLLAFRLRPSQRDNAPSTPFHQFHADPFQPPKNGHQKPNDNVSSLRLTIVLSLLHICQSRSTTRAIRRC